MGSSALEGGARWIASGLAFAAYAALAWAPLGCSRAAEPQPYERVPEVNSSHAALTSAPDTNCSWRTHNGHEYWLCRNIKTWPAARATCQSVPGLDLATVDSDAENTFLNDALPFTAWIGANDQGTEGNWKWAQSGSAFWSGGAGLCAFDAALAPNGRCFHTNSLPRTRANALSYCQARGAGWNLATLPSSSVNTFAQTLIFSSSRWIGANDISVEGSWRWRGTGTNDGIAFWQGGAGGNAVGGNYANWDAIEPNDAPSPGDCGRLLHTTGKWVDDSCSASFGTLCEGPSLGGNVVGGLYSNWVLGQPNDFANQDCAMIDAGVGAGKWQDESCALAAEFVCESTADLCPTDAAKNAPGQCGCGVLDTDTDGDGTANCNDACPSDARKIVPGDCGCANAPAAAGTACDDGVCATATTCDGAGNCGNPQACAPDTGCAVQYFQGQPYWFCGNDTSWTNARALCQAVGMDLAQIESAAENAFVTSHVFEASFIGATDDAVEGSWRWVNTNVEFWQGASIGGSVPGQYSNWQIGQPNLIAALVEDCAEINPLFGDWNTESCILHPEAFVCERSLRLETTPTWTRPATPSEGSFPPGGIDSTGGVLTTTQTAVLRIAPNGTSTTVATFTDPHRFNVEAAGTRFGVYTATAFEVRSSAGALIASHPRQPTGYGMLVSGSDLVFLPEMKDGGEDPRVTHARFFQPSGMRSRFPAPGLLISRYTPTHLVYSDGAQLIRTTVDGVETWRTTLALRTFEISSGGSALIGVIAAQGNSQIVHVDLATGVASAPTTLDGVFWNVVIAPGGRYSVATTKSAAYLFDGHHVARQVAVPANWIVSADVSDQGQVAIGAQEASHAAKVVLFTPTSQVSSFARPTTDDGHRPHVRFYAGGQKLLVNEPGGLSAFDIKPAP
jgi:hypothetical protein